MAEKIKVCNFDKKKQRTKTNINLRKLLHVRKKAFFYQKKRTNDQKIMKIKHEKTY